ncbi:MAG: DUF2163 domain-containing protein [Acidobacteriota bacterium]
MVTASAALVDFLASGAPCWQADLYTFSLLDGSVLRCSSHDRPITYGGDVYAALGPYIERSAIKLGLGLTASKIDVAIIADSNALVESQAILLTIAQGKWTQAGVTVRRGFMPTPGDCNLGGAGDGTIIRFVGQVGAISEVGPLHAKFEVRDLLWQLNRPLPQNLYQPGCWHRLFDAGCTLHEADFTSTGTVASGSSTTVIHTGLTNDSNIPGPPASAPTLSSTAGPVAIPAATYYVTVTYTTALGETVASAEASITVVAGRVVKVNSPASATGATGWNCYVGLGAGNEQRQNGAPIAIGTDYTMPAEGFYLSGILPPAFPTNGYWAQGVITFTSGPLAGTSAYVIASDGSGAVQLEVPLPIAPAAGVGFRIIPGCDKMPSTCQGKFNNLIHISAFPHVPTPEAGI